MTEEEKAPYIYCIKLMIMKIRQVCDGEITLDELIIFRKNMEESELNRTNFMN